MKTLAFLTLLYFGLILLTSTSEAQVKKKFPAHWGNPPKIQTEDLRPLPGGYGNGSSTLAKWISKNLEQDKKATAQDKQTQYGFDVIDKLADLGGVKRGIDSEGIKADVAQFDEEMNFPYKQVQFMQSLLQNLPLETQQYTYASPSQLADVAGGAGGLLKLYELLFGGGGNTLLPGGLGKEA